MNTLKFGNGEWYGKKDTILAYNDENSNFKPLPFSFDRDTLATRVNKDGLIETVGSGEPRIDYKDDSKGALLLEPSRTNLVTNSSEFTGGLIGVSILRNVETSPDGNVSADKLLNNSAPGEHLINSNITLNMVSGTSYTCSAFFKSDGTGGQGVIRYYNGSTFHYGVFNLENGDVSYNSSGTSKIEEFPNGWYRCSISFTSTGAYPNPPIQIGVGNALNQFSYQGASNLSYYFWGVQYEQGSYATSYIPTQGSIGTRVAESSSQTVPDGIIGQTEGTLYAKLGNIPNNAIDDVFIELSDGTSNNRILFYVDADGHIRNQIKSNGSISSLINTNVDVSSNMKIAITYKTNEAKVFINGVQYGGTDTSVVVPSVSKFNLENYTGTRSQSSSLKDVKLYNEALTDQELINLTTI